MFHKSFTASVALCALPLLLNSPAIASPVRYELTDVITSIGQYPTGAFGHGSLLGYFLFDRDSALGVTEYIITAVADNAVQFGWSSASAFPFPSSATTYFDPVTGVRDVIFRTSLGDRHGVILELAFNSSEFTPDAGTIPLITATANLDQTSNWYELINSEYAAFGNVRSGSLAVPEPLSISLVGAALIAALGLTRKRERPNAAA